MAYQRFLIDKDYKAVVSDDQFQMLVQGDENRLVQAEQNAEMKFMEYLDQHYEIEKLFNVGKSIRTYNAGVTYPANAYFKTDDGIFKCLKQINSCKKPTAIVYWEQIDDLWNIENLEQTPKYSQLQTYSIGDVVKFRTEYWRCKVANGYDIDNIQVPGVVTWNEVTVIPWEPNMSWELNQVCSYNNNFYTKVSVAEETTETESVITPDEDDTWAMIGDYSSDYQYETNKHDYVVCEDKVFEPNGNVNADKIETGVNITLDDPRNINVVTHMVIISTYNLHMMISPTNVSQTRRLAYEDSMLWLANARSFKINPKMPRKQICPENNQAVDFVVTNYQREFNPWDDMWLL